MKKIILVLGMLLIANSVFAFGDSDEFTWADYEVLCSMYGIEPNYEQYISLCENPQCLILE